MMTQPLPSAHSPIVKDSAAITDILLGLQDIAKSITTLEGLQLELDKANNSLDPEDAERYRRGLLLFLAKGPRPSEDLKTFVNDCRGEGCDGMNATFARSIHLSSRPSFHGTRWPMKWVCDSRTLRKLPFEEAILRQSMGEWRDFFGVFEEAGCFPGMTVAELIDRFCEYEERVSEEEHDAIHRRKLDAFLATDGMARAMAKTRRIAKQLMKEPARAT